MDTSIKIPTEDIIELNTIKNELLKRNLRFSQKDLLDTAVKFSLEHKNDFIRELIGRKKDKMNNNRLENTKRFLNLPKADLGKNWLKEIDTAAVEHKLRRYKK